MKALISVFDKTGVVEFGRKLTELGIELVSTGGTHGTLQDANLPVQQVSDLTGFPEILDGRVKTLHPSIHGGILARRDVPAHVSELENRSIASIDLVAVNLYPFADTIARPGVSLDEALENIDIGGPTMIRAAAKNFPFVAVVVDPSDYDWVVERMAAGGISMEERQRLAQKAFQHVAYYDTLIASYLRRDDPDGLFPQELTLAYRRVQELRYGENPHQQGALYTEPLLGFASLAGGAQVLGQEPSLCNVYDMSAALESVRDFADRPAAVVIKHATPSGFAFGATTAEALEKAIHADATSAFGGIIGLNRPMDVETAEVVARFRELESSNIDAIVAPGAADEAVAILRQTRRRMVLYTVDDLGPASGGQREPEAGTRRLPLPAGQHVAHRPGVVAGGYEGSAHAGAAAGHGRRLAADAPHPLQHHSGLGRGRGRDPGHRQRPGEPGGFGAHSPGAGRGARPGRDSRVGLLLPLPGQRGACRKLRDCGHCPAGRLNKRPGIHRRR